MNKHTITDLYQMQSLPLKYKITMTKQRIRGWYEHWDGDVYVSFSGGKDSTVLLDIVRQMYPDVPAVFVDTGLEYPEIREFVKTFDNVTWLKPRMNFRQVIEKYGYPMFSKEISRSVSDVKKHGENCFAYKFFNGSMKGSLYNKQKYIFLLNAPFNVSNKCCNVMKKTPLHNYSKLTNKKAFTAQMANESIQRQTQWLKKGCNAFESKEPISNPMSFWTEQDVLLYIKQNNLSICSVYGDIVEDRTGTDEVEGQLTISDLDGFEGMELFDAKRLPLKTTGCDRTGCMFCGYGCHLEKPGEGRFERMKETHPKVYEYVLKPWDEGGLGYKDVIDWINEHGNMNIRY